CGAALGAPSPTRARCGSRPARSPTAEPWAFGSHRFSSTEAPRLFVSLSPCLLVSLSPCLLVSLSPCLLVSSSPCLLVSPSPPFLGQREMIDPAGAYNRREVLMRHGLMARRAARVMIAVIALAGAAARVRGDAI